MRKVVIQKVQDTVIDLDACSSQELIKLASTYLTFQQIQLVKQDLFPRDKLITMLEQAIDFSNKFAKGEF